MLSKKSFLIDRRNFQGRWRVLRTATLGTISFHTKTTTDRAIGPTEPCSSENIEDSTFARFSEFFDLQLFRQHRPVCDIGRTKRPLKPKPNGSLFRIARLKRYNGLSRGVNKQRREFITLIDGSTFAWSLVAQAPQ